MAKLKTTGVCLIILILCACGTSPSPDNSSSQAQASAQAAAQAALDRMDGKPSSAAPAVPAAPVNTSRSQPAWVDSVDSVYGRSRYVAAVGHASDRAMAERTALANLAAFFGQSIKADQTIVNTYQEAVKNGAVTGWTDTVAMEDIIKTSVSMDLAGAEIKEVWYDSKSVYYAAAVMEKAKAAQLYTEMIKANQNMIDNLLNMTTAEKNTLEGFTRYQFSGTVADINTSYAQLLRLIDAQPPAGLKPGNDYRLEAQNIAKVIPVGLAVKNDKAGRIQGAFAKSLADLGFRSGANNSRYIIQVDIAISPVDLPNNTNKFARIEVAANLTDSGAVLLPYNFNLREGHLSVTEAENRAYSAAERKINEEYTDILSAYLSQILPKR